MTFREVGSRKKGFKFLLTCHRAEVRNFDQLSDASICRQKRLNELLPNQLNRAELHLIGTLAPVADMGELFFEPFQFTAPRSLESFKGFSEPVAKNRFAQLGRKKERRADEAADASN